MPELWRSKETDKRSQALLEALSVLNLTLLNDGKTPTFKEVATSIDFTFVNDGLSKDMIPVGR